MLSRPIQLLKRSLSLYDDESTQLRAHSITANGFQSGAVWMCQALGVIRGRTVTFSDPRTSFFILGFVKYLLASLAAGIALGAVILIQLPVILGLIAAGLAFYAVEVQFVFLFPIAIDGSATPWKKAYLMTRKIGTISAMQVVIPLAVVMLAGGLCGQGFVRCWCLGCLSIILWYEDELSSGITA